MKKALLLLFVLIGSTISAFAETCKDTYKGTVGPYEVVVKLSYEVEGFGPRISEVSGSYTYTKAGNTLYLSGEMILYPGPDSDQNLDYPIYDLTETTKAGKKSADWVLYTSEGGLYGKMTTKGKTFEVKLKAVK
ncbi:MAG: hypothetical protein K2H38_12430 [Muribaculaceae bacterium]|nr:hypothetical protein [Muribaculaceae bacterium]